MWVVNGPCVFPEYREKPKSSDVDLVDISFSSQIVARLRLQYTRMQLHKPVIREKYFGRIVGNFLCSYWAASDRVFDHPFFYPFSAHLLFIDRRISGHLVVI